MIPPAFCLPAVRRPAHVAGRALTVIIAVSLAGCGDGATDQEPTGADQSVRRSAEADSVTITLTATPKTVDLGERASVRVEITADTNVTVSPEPYARALTDDERQFTCRVVSRRSEEARPIDGGRLRWLYDYELEFVLAEEFELPPARLTYVELAGQDDDDGVEASTTEPRSLATEPITLIVTASADAALSEEQHTQIARLDPIELPSVWSRWWLLAPVLLVLVVLVVMAVRRRRRRRVDELVVVPAHVWARRALAALVAEDLVGHGLVQDFYYRVSDVVRGYIERRFGLSAPEMTTEEFLVAASADPRLDRTITSQLDRFLHACDLVKYARHEPTREACDGAMTAAADFVERTRERQETSTRVADRPESTGEWAA